MVTNEDHKTHTKILTDLRLRRGKWLLKSACEWMDYRLQSYARLSKQDTNIQGAITFSETAPPFLELTHLCSSFVKLVRSECILFLTSFLSACWKISLYVLLAKLLRYRSTFSSRCYCLLLTSHATGKLVCSSL
jgi:hypothetical protein